VSAALSEAVFEQWGADTVKDYLHRTDFCEALRVIVERRLQGGPWNLGSGVSTHLTDLVRLVETATDRVIKVNVQPAPEWDVQDNRLDIGKLWSAIDWRPTISLESGIAQEVQRLRG
jgi:nucleoside-diphosphate-sugar epimerase